MSKLDLISINYSLEFSYDLIISNNFKSKIKLNYKQDESLIGGLIVQVGSTMIDTSIKSKLQQIEKKMIEA